MAEVAVVIPARDAAATIGRAVAALVAQRDARGGAPEVLVVDDGSVDATAEVAAAAGARVLRAGGDGPARARNLGVAATAGSIVVFVDADCAPREGFLAALTRPLLEDPSVGGAKGAYESEQRALTARFVQQEYEARYARMARRPTIDFIDTYAAAYRRDLLVRVGGFDERYRRPSTEDQELSFRVAAAGARLVFVPAARVAHLHADAPWAYAKKKARIGYFKVATLRRHPGKALDDAHTPPGLKLQVALAPLVPLGLAGAGAGLAGGAPPALAGLGLAPLAALLLLGLPLIVRCLRRDPAVGLAAPAFVVLRAGALAAGLLTGVLAELRGGVLPDAPAAAPAPPAAAPGGAP